jgi:hypothetical protein
LLLNTAGCWSVSARYELTDACGLTGAGAFSLDPDCDETTISAVVFPASPALTQLDNTCDEALADITAVADVAGFTATYSVTAPGGSPSAYGTLAAANALLLNTAGCWSVSARYELTDACGLTGAGAFSLDPDCDETTINAVVFPASPVLTQLDNTCDEALADITAVADVAGFTATYSVTAPGGSPSAYGTLAAANALLLNTAGCLSLSALF